MMSLARQRKADPSGRRSRRFRAAFTLVEIVISLAVIGTMASGVYVGFNSLNAYAVGSRLYSDALTAAQNEIDVILSKSPFDVNAAYVSGSFNASLNKIPAQLMTTSELDSAGITFPSSAPTATPATTDSYYPYYPYYRTGSGQPLQKQAFIYQDPVSGKTVVTGTLTVTITDPGLTMTYFTSTNLNTRKANVSVTYSFRGKNYTVSLDSMRTADQ